MAIPILCPLQGALAPCSSLGNNLIGTKTLTTEGNEWGVVEGKASVLAEHNWGTKATRQCEDVPGQVCREPRKPGEF